MGELHRVEGYVRCKDCGKLVPEPFAFQTTNRCSECWTGESPLLALEVMHRGSRRVLRMQGQKESKPRKPGKDGSTYNRPGARMARFAAWRRLQQLFPDVYEVILDEERVRRGLHPIARYTPIDYDEVVSKTLDFHDVYDALRSSGVTDGP